MRLLTPAIEARAGAPIVFTIRCHVNSTDGAPAATGAQEGV
jgi:hypothetical protein